MTSGAVRSDPYRRRREAAAASRAATRQQLLVAADALFREQGYLATSVAAITERAGVSLQTLYLAWGSKRALLRAAADAAASVSDLPLEPEQWQAHIRAQLAANVGDDATAPTYLAAVARLFVTVTERTQPYRRLQQQAAASDPEIATDWAATAAARRHTMHAVAQDLPRVGLRPGLDQDVIADTLFAIASPEVYDLLSTEAGYTSQTFSAWLERTLTAALCTDA